MDIETIRHYFNEEKTVEHYARAAVNIGLWQSEELVFEKYLNRNDSILDLGCGAGRVTLALARASYLKLLGVDLAEEMISQAKGVADYLGLSVPFEQGDATDLRFADSVFDAVVFAFNGLMQIPGAGRREAAVAEIFRVLKPGGYFIFTALDRESPLYREVFKDLKDPAHDLSVNSNLVEFGDRHFKSTHGTTFMHVAIREEVTAMLGSVGFELVEDRMRSSLARETAVIQDFSEDCRFWIARRPADV